MKSLFWWFGISLSSLLALSFLIFGISILIISFSVNNALISIATIFSSSLMILVSLSLLAGLTIKIVARVKGSEQSRIMSPKTTEKEIASSGKED